MKNQELQIQEDLVAPESNVKDFRKKMESFTKVLNTAPDPKKIQTHQGYQYIPVSSIEKDLHKIYFGLVQYECMGYQQIFNEVACHARIKVFHPIINQWLNYDGLGSAVLQQDKDTKVSDFHLFKKPNAGQLTYPKAYAEAIKNAAKKIGKRFGSDVNRKFEDEYELNFELDGEPTPMKKKDAIVEVPDEIEHLIAICETKEQLSAIWNDKKELQSNPKFIQYLSKRKFQL